MKNGVSISFNSRAVFTAFLALFVSCKGKKESHHFDQHHRDTGSGFKW